MGLFVRKHYVYVSVSLRVPYIGKGSGDRMRESMKERHGIACFKVGRYFTSSGAYRTESRLIRNCRRSGVPLQNGRAPNQSFWRGISSRPARRQRTSLRDRLVGAAVLGGLIWWLFA